MGSKAAEAGPDARCDTPVQEDAKRQQLRAGFREARRADDHIRWNFDNETELDNAVLKLRNDSENPRAESLFADVLASDSTRAEARQAYFSFLVFTIAARAKSRGTLAEAESVYQEAARHARRFVEDEPKNETGRSDLSVSHTNGFSLRVGSDR